MGSLGTAFSGRSSCHIVGMQVLPSKEPRQRQTAEFKANAMRRRLLARPEIAEEAEGCANGGQAVAGELQSDRICKALESAVKGQRGK